MLIWEHIYRRNHTFFFFGHKELYQCININMCSQQARVASKDFFFLKVALGLVRYSLYL